MAFTCFLATSGSGVSRTERQSNDTWRVENLILDQDVRCLAVNPQIPNVVYAGTQGNGLLRSEDAGKTWTPAGLAGHSVKAISVSPIDPNTVYVGTKPPHLFVSHDGSQTWTEVEPFRQCRRWFWRSPAETPFTPYVQAIGLSPTDANIIVIGIEAGAVVRSADGGKTWTGHRKAALRDCHSLTFHATSGEWVYEAGGTGAGAAFSNDAGQTWTQPGTGLDRHYGWACAADPANPAIWYISASPHGKLGPPLAHIDGKANAYIFRWKDNAWKKLNGGLPQPLDYMAYGLLTDPTAPGHLYAGLSMGEVWHSTDYGDTWQKLPFKLNSVHRTLAGL